MNRFMVKYFPDFEYHAFYCRSWIISPNLKHVLSPSSNIIQFIDMFQIYDVDLTSESYKRWVFKNGQLGIDDFPQDTSLQRNLTAYLKTGAQLGEGMGIITRKSL